MDEKITLIQIMIHHLRNIEVVIRYPTSLREAQLLNIAHQKAVAWGKANNLKIIKNI